MFENSVHIMGQAALLVALLATLHAIVSAMVRSERRQRLEYRQRRKVERRRFFELHGRYPSRRRDCEAVDALVIRYLRGAR